MAFVLMKHFAETRNKSKLEGKLKQDIKSYTGKVGAPENRQEIGAVIPQRKSNPALLTVTPVPPCVYLYDL